MGPIRRLLVVSFQQSSGLGKLVKVTSGKFAFSFCTYQGWDNRDSNSPHNFRCPAYNACISGTSSTVNYDPCLASTVCNTKILVVEGYLFELPDTIKTITKACEEARRSGAVVAVTASDVSCIERHYDDFWEIVGNYADIFLQTVTKQELSVTSPQRRAPFQLQVTDGPRGSYIGVKGEAVYIPPSPCVPVDTCGAGDAYASGVLYGILRGVSDLKGIGTLAARVAATVVGQQGTRLRIQDAVELAESFAFNLDSSTIRSDIGSDHISSF
ncbi:pfkB-like carbohydrate kinase family protein [Prunus dulcis]|uniref:PfkB-like carbohydrate kinase family protein n=1 Tax=Prunus dulcis TaxID=3755 RepID=A0A4Y1R392_PRUDU|nr:pfkB-like carbohydrate kinase family protein [Prunus dulcis]